MRNLLRTPDPEDGNGQDPELQKSQPTSSPPVSPTIVSKGKKSSPKEEREWEERMAAAEARNQELSGQLADIQKKLSDFGKTTKGKGFMDSFRQFLGWDE